MNIKKTFLITIFLILNLTSILQSQENKILIKVNNEIITSLDLLNEMKYLESINKEFRKTKKNQAFEISKNSLIREKIKEIELKKLMDEIRIEDKTINNILINYFERLGINSISKFNRYFIEKKIDPNVIKKKITIEILWNQLIYQKFYNSIKIDRGKIKSELLSKELLKEFNLSEILFTVSENESLDEKFDLVKKTIKEKNFSQAALLYSISDTAKNGGELGWIKETSINLKIRKKIDKIKKGQYTNPIVVPGGFLIINIKDQRTVKRDTDLKKEIELVYKKKVNEQLNQYSNIFFNKVKNNMVIDEI
jgi:peptidyl-prolyl cis-trans isomerase SurA